jgi:hypothetical protein
LLAPSKHSLTASPRFSANVVPRTPSAALTGSHLDGLWLLRQFSLLVAGAMHNRRHSELSMLCRDSHTEILLPKINIADCGRVVLLRCCSSTCMLRSAYQFATLTRTTGKRNRHKTINCQRNRQQRCLCNDHAGYSHDWHSITADSYLVCMILTCICAQSGLVLANITKYVRVELLDANVVQGSTDSLSAQVHTRKCRSSLQ